jgi:hypothetical protein
METLLNIGIFVLALNGAILSVMVVLYFKKGRCPDKKALFEESVEYLFENNQNCEKWVLEEKKWIDKSESCRQKTTPSH